MCISKWYVHVKKSNKASTPIDVEVFFYTVIFSERKKQNDLKPLFIWFSAFELFFAI
jgi:hypothetical protein